jgi:hypothetical protein
MSVGTDMMEVFSLEENDQIYVNGVLYRIIAIDYDELAYHDHILTLADEEGSLKKMCATSHQKVRLVLDNDYSIV